MKKCLLAIHRLNYVLALGVALLACRPARADLYQFTTETTAIQTISSPLVGANPVTTTAKGTLNFTINTSTGIASVTTNSLVGTLYPGGPTYSLYNTTTAGTVTLLSGNVYTVSFPVLFDLQLTSGPLNGVIFSTKTNANFIADTLLPFPAGTTLADPHRTGDPSSPDAVGIYTSAALPGGINAGDLVGYSYNRTVILNSVLPEPSSYALMALGIVCIATGYGYRRRFAVAS